ncbi:MAG: Hsp20/alpha crystallin family protein [Bacteroidota bacterium]
MSDNRSGEDTFKNITDGLFDSVSQFGKKVGNFMDDMFSGEGMDDGEVKIKADVYYTENQFVIAMEMAGVKKEETSLQIIDGVLSIKGIKKEPEGYETFSFHKQERRFGSFIRTFPLPLDIEMENIKAKYEAGILIVRFPWKGKPASDDQGINIES